MDLMENIKSLKEAIKKDTKDFDERAKAEAKKALKLLEKLQKEFRAATETLKEVNDTMNEVWWEAGREKINSKVYNHLMDLFEKLQFRPQLSKITWDLKHVIDSIKKLK